MNTTEKIKKRNLLYMLVYNVFIPVGMLVLGTALGVALPEKVGLVLAIVSFGWRRKALCPTTPSTPTAAR